MPSGDLFAQTETVQQVDRFTQRSVMLYVLSAGKSVQQIDCYLVCPYAEPSPEEKLQKLHTDIKFALKVDNPVSDVFDFGKIPFPFFLCFYASMKTNLF